MNMFDVNTILLDYNQALDRLFVLLPMEKKRVVYLRIFKWIISCCPWRYHPNDLRIQDEMKEILNHIGQSILDQSDISSQSPKDMSYNNHTSCIKKKISSRFTFKLRDDCPPSLGPPPHRNHVKQQVKQVKQDIKDQSKNPHESHHANVTIGKKLSKATLLSMTTLTKAQKVCFCYYIFYMISTNNPLLDE